MTKASKIAVAMLDVGQGSATFVEIYTGTKITATALLDLGAERAKDEAGGPSIDYIVTQLNTMTKPRIDFFSLSHSDSDHINLVQDLLSRFDPPGTKKPTKPILEIGKIVYGGPRRLFAKHGGANTITALEAYQPAEETKPKPLPSNSTSYRDSVPIFARDEVNFYLLVGNHIHGAPRSETKTIKDTEWKPDSYSLNTYSLIFIIVFDDWRYVVTGDATGATISQANYFIKTYSVTFGNVAALTMPHHSSEPTTFGLTKSHGKRARETERVPDAAKEVIDTFSNSIEARSIFASAEEVGGFRHPSAFVMSFFWNHVRKTSWYADPALTNNQHLYNAYFTTDDGYDIDLATVDPVSKKIINNRDPLIDFSGWRTFGTQHAIFTNRYYVRSQAYDEENDQTATFPPNPAKLTSIPKSGAADSPPFAVAWRYTSDAATEKTALERLVNRKDGGDFVAFPVMLMSKDDDGAPGDRPVAVPPPSRTMALRPPARPAMPPIGGEIARYRWPPQRLRQLDA